MIWSRRVSSDGRVSGTLGRDVEFWPDPEFPEWIRTLPMPHAMRDRQSMVSIVFFLLLIFIFAGAFVITGLSLQNNSTLSIFELLIPGFLMAVLAILCLSYLSEIHRERRFLRKYLRESKWAPWLRALAQAKIPFRRCSQRKAERAWERLQAELDREGLESPRTLADLRLASELQRIDLVEELIEPERVVSGSRADRTRRRNSIFFGVILILGGIFLTGTLCIIIGILLVVIPLLSLESIRQKAPNLGLGFNTTIAGAGFLQINDTTRCTSDDSILLVRSIGPRRITDPAIEVWILSAQIIRLYTFPTCRDPFFVTLWQRWNHPQPRPDLAGSA